VLQKSPDAVSKPKRSEQERVRNTPALRKCNYRGLDLDFPVQRALNRHGGKLAVCRFRIHGKHLHPNLHKSIAENPFTAGSQNCRRTSWTENAHRWAENGCKDLYHSQSKWSLRFFIPQDIENRQYLSNPYDALNAKLQLSDRFLILTSILSSKRHVPLQSVRQHSRKLNTYPHVEKSAKAG